MFEELNKKSPASRMSSNALPEFRSMSQVLLFSLIYYAKYDVSPDVKVSRAKDLYKWILEEIPSLAKTEILITPKNMVEETKEIVDYIFNKRDEGLERLKKEAFGNPFPSTAFSFKDYEEQSNRIVREAEEDKVPKYRGCCDSGVPEAEEDKVPKYRGCCDPGVPEAEEDKVPKYRGCCDPGVPEDKCEPDTEPDTENVCQGHPCGKQECECDEVPEDRRPGYEHERETSVTSDSGSDV